jgi:uncharacterized protein YggE
MRPAFITFSTILFFFTALFAFFKLLGPIPLNVSTVTTSKNDLFTVSGQGKVAVKPDTAHISVGVSQDGPTAKAAQDKMNAAINEVTANIKKAGIPDSDITTSNYSIYPNQDFSQGSSKIIGYKAQSTVEVKVKKLDQLNTVIDTATANGANQISGINFDVDDKSAFEDQARKMAVADAQKKAAVAAKTGGFSIGRIISYNESNNSPGPIPFATARSADVKAAPQTSVEPGSLDVTLDVTLGYEIR